MFQVKIENCNNILDGIIEIKEGKLNILYGINGTGKTTIAKAIEASNNSNLLTDLKSYYTDKPACVSITPGIPKILVFNEDFVENIVFEKDEVIQNSFEVFLKTPTYSQKKEKVDQHLQILHDIIKNDDEICELQKILNQIISQFKYTSSGKLRKTGTLKSVVSKNNLYNIPEELESYRPFITNTNINIEWIDWKSKGDNFDIEDGCPYCSEPINREVHNKRKEVFKKTYKKSDSQHLKDLLDMLEKLKDYLKPEGYNKFLNYIKEGDPEDVIMAAFTVLMAELKLLQNRFENIASFGNRKIAIADISKLEEQIKSMEIQEDFFNIFGGEKFYSVIQRINNQVTTLRTETAKIKQEMGDLKAVMQATIRDSQNDINEFLKTAGINYEIEIQAEDETDSRTILKQCFGEDHTNVEKIRDHLSWGERNAFSLVLFMYYAIQQEPDLIILDDPISSFDTNKKYAILHRMFKNGGKQDVSLRGKTVLFLTHDFEPITDFVIIGKLDSSKVQASFICNERGLVREKKINSYTDVKLITNECSEIAKDKNINIISRIVFLRKLSEIFGERAEWNSVYEILSSLIHGSEIRRKIGGKDYEALNHEEISAGTAKIKEYIPDFDFDKLQRKVFTRDGIKLLYFAENNNYFKMQIFRELSDILPQNTLKLGPNDEAWYKFIDETYHIENDYVHFLDITKFNIVPSYIVDQVDGIMKDLYKD